MSCSSFENKVNNKEFADKVYIYIYSKVKVKLATIVEGNLMAPF